MKKTLFPLLAAALLLLTTQSYGQSTGTESATKRVYLNSVLGLSFPGAGNLNTELTKAGFLPLSGTYFARGAGFYTLFPKVRLATIFNFSSYSGTGTDNNRSTWVRGTTAGTALGIIVRNTSHIQVIPYAGLAYSWFGTRLSKVAPGSTTFSGYLSGPANQQHLALEQFLGNVGLHVVKPGLGKSALAKQLIIGLRGGYFFPLNTPTWQTNTVDLTGGPTINPGGAYLHLIIGSSL